MHSTPKPHSLFRFLKSHPDFTCLWFASVVSLLGDWFNHTALMGLVLEKTGSSMSAGFLMLCSIVPMTILTPLAGPIADRINRRTILITSNILAAIVALAFMFIKGPEQIWLVYLFTVILVSLATFSGPAGQAAIPNLVGKDGLLSANALNSAAWGSMLALGAGLGGIVSGLFGRNACFTVNSISFLLAAFLIGKIKRPLNLPLNHGESQPPLHVIKDFKEGFYHALSDPVLRLQIIVKAGWGLGAGVLLFLAVLPVQVWKHGDSGIGILYCARGIGAVLGPFLARRIARNDEKRMYNIIIASILGNGLFYLGFSLASNIWLGAVYVTIAHLGGGAAWVLTTVLIQSRVPDNLQGRILSLDMAFITTTMTLSTIFAGWAATYFPPRGVAAFESLVIVAFGLLWWFLIWRAKLVK